MRQPDRTDPTSHKLRPLEPDIGISCALAGGLVAIVITKVVGRPASGRP